MKTLSFLKHMDAPLFPLAVATLAAEFEINTVRSWLQRGTMKLSFRETAAENGLPHLLTFRSTVALAIACKLVRLGVPASEAFEHARQFSDFGSDFGITPQRLPCGLFEGEFRTILVSRPSWEPQIIAIPDSENWAIPGKNIFYGHATRLIDLTTLYHRIVVLCAGHQGDDGESGEQID